MMMQNVKVTPVEIGAAMLTFSFPSPCGACGGTVFNVRMSDDGPAVITCEHCLGKYFRWPRPKENFPQTTNAE